MNEYLKKVLNGVREKNLYEPEYLQAVEEVLTSIEPVINQHPEYEKIALLERMIEPDRIVIFRVPYVMDNGQTVVQRRIKISSER